MRLQQIEEAVSDCCFGLNLRKKSRRADYVMARAIYYVIAKEDGSSITTAADFLGYNQHSMGSTACSNHQKNLKKNEYYKDLYQRVRYKLDGKITPILTSSIPPSILRKLLILDKEQLVEFEKTRLDPYLKTTVL